MCVGGFEKKGFAHSAPARPTVDLGEEVSNSVAGCVDDGAALAPQSAMQWLALPAEQRLLRRPHFLGALKGCHAFLRAGGNVSPQHPPPVSISQAADAARAAPPPPPPPSSLPPFPPQQQQASAGTRRGHLSSAWVTVCRPSDGMPLMHLSLIPWLGFSVTPRMSAQLQSSLHCLPALPSKSSTRGGAERLYVRMRSL